MRVLIRSSPRLQTLLFSSALCLVWLFSSRPAKCAPLGAALEVERESGAEDCPSSAELTSNVEHILQRALASDPRAGEALHVSVHFTLLHTAERPRTDAVDAQRPRAHPAATGEVVYNLRHPDTHWYPATGNAAFPANDVLMHVDWFEYYAE
ncbi:MAG TPA: hypothetical protein VIK01_25815 [Polyangiaceae bacterium]